MKRSIIKPAGMPVPLAALALSACSNNSASVPLTGAMPQRFTTSAARWAAPPHPDRRPSWISPRLAHAKSPVLFVSDSETASVYIYDLSTLDVLATITGLSQPQGECSDSKGNVWITDANAQTIYEVSHQGGLENELSDSLGYPVGCAWDKTTGALAVMNIFGESGAPGAVLIFKGGSGLPTSYTNASQYNYYFGGYDAKGNLFFDGLDAGGNFMLSSLPKKAKSASTITLSGGTIYFPGMVQWDAARHGLIVGDQSCGNRYASCLYTLHIGRKRAMIAATTELQNSSGGTVCDLVQGVEFGGQIAGSDNDFCGSLPSATYLWPYPAGGAPTLYNNSTDETPVGAAVSL